jgi:4-diphosphocytidyl-2-C-methyl-D-erythritol kinase
MMFLESPAKLTLSLRVVGVRTDGYHLIDAEMVALDIADHITIVDADTTQISLTGPYAQGIATDASNLVHRALSLAGRTAHVTIHKNIPHGGGLGGGSSNAAAILRWARFTDRELAATIGADVPFSLIGGRAQVQGIGEIVHPLVYEPRDITLLIPPVHTPTPLVYRTWDEMGGPTSDGLNDLEPAALQAVPELALWRERISQALGQQPHLAGSGSTWFVYGHASTPTEGLEGLQVVHTTTRPDAGRVEEHLKGEN